jgi:hypothetical protein
MVLMKNVIPSEQEDSRIMRSLFGCCFSLRVGNIQKKAVALLESEKANSSSTLHGHCRDKSYLIIVLKRGAHVGKYLVTGFSIDRGAKGSISGQIENKFDGRALSKFR